MKLRFAAKSISRRWFVNTIGVVLLLLTVSITALSFTLKNSTYSGIEQTITGRMDELLNWITADGRPQNASEFSAIARDYIESFPDKDSMEIMALNRSGAIFVTSTGFEPDQSQEMPDYEEALRTASNTGQWVGRLNTGEKVMAVTRVVRSGNGSITGSVRYLVSMERADAQTHRAILILVAAGVFIMLLITFSGIYFIRSILVPVQQVSDSAKKIAQGDFAVRIAKARDDELGQLCDSINDMAGELAASELLKNDFISSVSHELRTPLTAIQGWAETLQEDPDPATSQKGMAIIIREAGRLSGLVEELLDFSRLQSGRMRLLVSRVDVMTELDAAVFLFTDRAHSEGKDLVYEETATLPPVYGDVNRLRQVFVNILDNALKYTGPGGSITVSARESAGRVTATIRDTGCGIPAEHLPFVKKKFYKANQLVRGSGIGLAVADEIVTMHGGELTVESQEGVGTAVRITLPTCRLARLQPERTAPEIQKYIQERGD